MTKSLHKSAYSFEKKGDQTAILLKVIQRGQAMQRRFIFISWKYHFHFQTNTSAYKWRPTINREKFEQHAEGCVYIGESF